MRFRRALSLLTTVARRGFVAQMVGLVAFVVGVANLVVVIAWGLPLEVVLSPDLVAGVASPLTALVILRREPENLVGWVFLAIGCTSAGWGASTLALMAGVPATGPGAVVASVATWGYYPAFALTFTAIPLLFPNGHLPSRSWRPAAAMVGGVIVATLLVEAFGQPVAAAAPVENPLLVPSVEVLAPRLDPFLTWAWWIAVVVGGAAAVARLTGSTGALRAQMLWFVVAYIVGVAALLLFQRGVVLAIGLPAATAVAIVRYRLYGIEVVVRRAVTYGGLAALVTAFCVTIIVGLGSLPGRSSSDLRLVVVATIVSVLAVQPLRGWLLSVAHRVAYGPRATPYEALAGLGHRVGAAMSADDVLPAMAEAVYAALPVDQVTVRAFLRDGTSTSATVPRAGTVTDQPAERLGVRHQGHAIGEIDVHLAAAASPSPSDRRLLRELADHAGPAMEAVALSTELNRRLEELVHQTAELQASRARLVAAQDEARRSLERDIHDGAQQQLLALTVELSRAERLAGSDPAATGELLRKLQGWTSQTLADLRALASGAFPPALRNLGVGPALRARLEDLGGDVTVLDEVHARLAPEVEATVYFVCLEAVQNASKYAPGAPVTVTLEADGDGVNFAVTDRGPGFDARLRPSRGGLQNMMDRVAAVGGEVEVRADSAGTTITGRIPLVMTPADAR